MYSTQHSRYISNTIYIIGCLLCITALFHFYDILISCIKCSITTHKIMKIIFTGKKKVNQWDWGQSHRAAFFSVSAWQYFSWPHNVSHGLLLTTSLCMSRTMLPPRDWPWMCLCWVMLTLTASKVEHSVFMQFDEETVSATFCGRLPAHLFLSDDASDGFSVSLKQIIGFYLPLWGVTDSLAVIGHGQS